MPHVEYSWTDFNQILYWMHLLIYAIYKMSSEAVIHNLII